MKKPNIGGNGSHELKKKKKTKEKRHLKSVCWLLQISLGVGVLFIMLFFPFQHDLKE